MPLKPAAPVLLLALGQVRHHVLPLVPLAPLDHDPPLERLQQGRSQALRAVDHSYHSSADVKASGQSATAGTGRASARSPSLVCTNPRMCLLPCQIDAYGDDHLVVGETLAIQEHRHEIQVRQTPFLELTQHLGAGLDEPVRDRRVFDRPIASGTLLAACS